MQKVKYLILMLRHHPFVRSLRVDSDGMNRNMGSVGDDLTSGLLRSWWSWSDTALFLTGRRKPKRQWTCCEPEPEPFSQPSHPAGRQSTDQDQSRVEDIHSIHSTQEIIWRKSDDTQTCSSAHVHYQSNHTQTHTQPYPTTPKWQVCEDNGLFTCFLILLSCTRHCQSQTNLLYIASFGMPSMCTYVDTCTFKKHMCHWV